MLHISNRVFCGIISNFSPYSSRPISPEPHPSTTPTTNEVSRLRKQLAESRSRVLKLESSCEEIRTQSAKYQGSLQALTTIRDRLTEENTSLSEAKRRAEEGQRSAEEGSRRAEEGRRVLSRQLSSLQGLVTGLRSQVAELNGENEEAMVRKGLNVHKMCVEHCISQSTIVTNN